MLEPVSTTTPSTSDIFSARYLKTAPAVTHSSISYLDVMVFEVQVDGKGIMAERVLTYLPIRHVAANVALLMSVWKRVRLKKPNVLASMKTCSMGVL